MRDEERKRGKETITFSYKSIASAHVDEHITMYMYALTHTMHTY